MKNKNMKKNDLTLFLLLAFFVLLCAPVSGQIPFRVMTYNGLGVNGSETQFTNRLPYFRTVIQGVNPDILVMQEIVNAHGADSILRVMNEGGMQYARTPFINAYDTDNMLFYRTSKVSFISQDTISTPLRAFNEYVVTIGGKSLRIYSCHLKAGLSDSIRRRDEVTILRNYLNSLPEGAEFIIAGDMNFYRSTEPGYQKFIANENNNIGQAKDLSSLVGHWNNNYSYRFAHTQSTRIRPLADSGSTGGLDDRFDFIFTSYNFNNGSSVEYVANTHTVYGNDGNHFNDSINRLPNSAVSDIIANALHYASDHLPVYADFISYPDPVVDPDVIINEILHGSAYKDAVELLALKPGGIDLRGWILTDLYSPSATPASAEGTLTLPNNPFLQNVPRYTRIVLIADAGGTTLPFSIEDTVAVNDSMIVLLPTTLGGSLMHNGSSRFSLAVNDNIVLLTGPDLVSGTLIDKVSYGGDMSGWTSGTWSNNLNLPSGNIAYFTNDQLQHYNNDNGAIGWTSPVSELNHSLGRLNLGQNLGIHSGNEINSNRFELYPNYPNPFNPSTVIRYQLAVNSLVTIKIYNMLGQEVRTLVNENQSAGFRQVMWDGMNNHGIAVPSGLYICRIVAGNFIKSNKMLLIK